MNLYTFSYQNRQNTGFFQVIAESQDRAEKLLQQDGYKLIDIKLETVFTLDNGYPESIIFSMLFE